MDMITAIIGLIGAFYFAGAEAAYTTFNKIRLDIWQRQNKTFIKPALYFRDRPEDFFSTVLIGNNFANILCSTFATVVLLNYFDETVTWALVTLLILFVGEILPKTVFWTIADILILPTLFLARIFYFLFKPVIISLNFLMERFLRLFKIRHTAVKDYFSRDELELLISAGMNKKDFSRPEQKYITNVLEFMESTVREAMTPRTELVAAPEHTGFDRLLQLMINKNSRSVLIYRESLDNIIGVVFDWAMLDPMENITALIQPVYFIPENKNCAQLLKEFQQKNISLAVVLDEFGGTAGMIMMDDLIEEVFGEFQQTGSVASQIRALNDHTWLVDGRMEIDELSDLSKILFEEGDYETVAGFILEKIGRIPKPGETFPFGRFRIQIVNAGRNRIEQIKLIKNLEKSKK